MVQHIDIQYNGNVNQSSLDEIYIAMDNFDEASKVEGNVAIGNYTPMVVNAIQEKYGVTITPSASSKKYIEIDPQYRAIQNEFAKYSDDDSGHITEEAAAKVTSLSINTLSAEIWNMTGWFDKFEKIANLPFFCSSNNVANDVTKEVIYIGVKGLVNSAFRGYTALRRVVFCGKIANANGIFYGCSSLEEVVLDNTVVSSLEFSECFFGCNNLKIISLKNVNLQEGTYNIANMFNGAKSVRKVYMQGCNQYTVDLWRSWLDGAGLAATEIIT